MQSVQVCYAFICSLKHEIYVARKCIYCVNILDICVEQ
jgi:hypothetical protein